jgi:hypothetical protein
VPRTVLSRGNLNPVAWALCQPQIAAYLVELPPLRRQLAESALTTIPTFVIGGSKTVALAGDESQSADILRTELRELVGVHSEQNNYIMAFDDDSWVRSIWLSIPSLIQLPKRRHGIVAK